MILFEIVLIIAILLSGLVFPLLLKLTERHIVNLRWLWLYHILFGIIYYWYVTTSGGDSSQYWNGAKEISGDDAIKSLVESRGTLAMYGINYIPASVLGLSHFAGTMIYTFIGYLGLVFFYKIAVELIPYNYKIKYFYIFPAIFYFPNLHFWSCGVGKDTLLFFCIGLFSYSLIKLQKRLLWSILSLVFAYIVRPHVVLFILAGFSLAYLMNSKIARFKRVLLFLVLFGIGAALIPSVMAYTNIEELSVSSYSKYSEKKASNLSREHTGSSLDVSQYPLPVKILTFLYRPTFIDVTNITSLLAAVENLILLILTYIMLKNNPIDTFRRAPFILKGLIFLLAIGTLAFSMSLGNLGIMLRMRNMLLPGLLLFICWSYSYRIQRIMSIKQLKGV